MRVLTVGNMYPPHHFGGYELVWRSAVEHLRARGHEVRVLTTDVNTGARDPDDPGVHRELRWALRDGAFPALGLRERATLARHNHGVLGRHLDEFAPDVVGWWSMGGLSLTMLETVRRRGVGAVAFVHDEWLDYGRSVDAWLHTFAGRRRRRLAPLAGRLAGVPAEVDFAGAASYVFVSDHVRRHARGLGLGLHHTAVAHSGVHPDFLEPAPEQRWGWRLLYAGRLDARKGVDVAVEALARLPREARLTIVGGWDLRERERLRGLADARGVTARVTFAGQHDRGGLMAAYAAADAVLFPVRWQEPWGLVPLEAMGRGRPVVATGTGGSGEYLRDGENCLLATPGDPDALAAAVMRLAGEPRLRSRLREAGFKTAARHTEPIFNAAAEAATVAAAAGDAPLPEPTRALRILHLGTGFRPFRRGGLIAYAEDLMAEQARAGHEVTYLFSGRHYPLLRGPRLRRWSCDGVALLEVVNSPLYDHGAQPELEAGEPRLERVVQRLIAEVRPDVVHVQELAGLPSSVLDVARAAGVATVVTLQDYFAVCPAFKLLDADGDSCAGHDPGVGCAATIAALPRNPTLMFEATLRHHLFERSALSRLGPRSRAAIGALSDRVVRRACRPQRRRPAAPAAAFLRRRTLNVERLNAANCVVAMSRRVAELHAELGVAAEHLRTMQLTLGHIEHLRPRTVAGTAPVTFATLGGAESPAKGSRILLDAARGVADLAGAGRLRLLVFGTVDDAFAAAAAAVAGVEIRGAYAPHALDAVLDEVDVGIVPSVWEEAYGYVGPELLAKGIPVIGNATGGIVDYVRDGETGWLNQACTGAGLAQIMRDIVARPEQVATLNARIRAARADLVLPLSRHAAEMEGVYREVIAR
jgi:glycogen(starch) synthase